MSHGPTSIGIHGNTFKKTPRGLSSNRLLRASPPCAILSLAIQLILQYPLHNKSMHLFTVYISPHATRRILGKAFSVVLAITKNLALWERYPLTRFCRRFVHDREA